MLLSEGSSQGSFDGGDSLALDGPSGAGKAFASLTAGGRLPIESFVPGVVTSYGLTSPPFWASSTASRRLRTWSFCRMFVM